MASLMPCIAMLGVWCSALPAWDFDSAEDAQVWAPNAHLANVRVADGVLSADTVDWDPSFLNRSVAFVASPYQYVAIRLRASKGGAGDLYWSGSLEGRYGGLAEEKKVRFVIPGDGEWHDIVAFPFWHTEGEIRQLRLDLFNDAHFDIDWIRIGEWGDGRTPEEHRSWDLGGDLSSWQVYPGAAEYFAPPLRLDVTATGWVTALIRSETAGPASILWACGDERGMKERNFALRGDGALHVYNFEMTGVPTWRAPVVAVGLRLPAEGPVHVESVSIGEDPAGPPELDISCFAFVDAPNRAGRPCAVLVRVVNIGGLPGQVADIALDVPDGLRVVQPPESTLPRSLSFGEYEDFVWTVQAERPGEYPVSVRVERENAAPATAEAVLGFSAPLNLPSAAYVPPPRPVQTHIDICAYYFPGWNSDAKWDCIRRVAPIRKPVLGYYDEGNPECVDWQIKWAVENGISCFLVDWYWSKGAQHLTHWFEAYRRARYRDYLKVAIMWANHNPPGSHSPEDWRAVTREWIEKYFPLETYYRLENKPAVFIWDPENIRKDLGGSEAVRKSLEESQSMAMDAGFEGISFVAMGYDFGSSRIQRLLQEGYCGITTYHEWGASTEGAFGLRRMRFEDVARTAPAAWQEKHDAAGSLVYYPVVDTGWDSRPWHGDDGLVIEGRTPDLFEDLLDAARTFCEANRKPLVVLGPMNEWGEGSYIEPCTEFGFEMLERVRGVFGKGDPGFWPVNIAPSDVGLGPYDFPPREIRTAWTFDDGPQGWDPIMNVRDFRCEDGALRFRSTSNDPALLAHLNGTLAGEFPAAVVRMAVRAAEPVSGAVAQFFWSAGGAAITEATSMRFRIEPDGVMREYRVNLKENPRWRGRIAAIRFDPCDLSDAEVVIDEFRLVRAGE